MRLHSLEVTAFGPFADTVRVDFDRLADAGLFLLSGATGAGKTSVLDAVCFALYGDVPGDRGSARRLRSDHASPGVPPEVTLEATLAGRRFRIVRSPAWERPKRRGTGTTTQQAQVSLAERRDGEWVHLSSRLDETGHLVTELVGMNLTQFTQVAMLPQGRFQAFLRARSEERHQLLQRLFRTGRFEQVEHWLREQRRRLRREGETAHQEVADLVSRVSEATDRPLPEGWDARDLSSPAADGRLLTWAEGLRDDAAAGRAESETLATDRGAAEQRARRELDDARALVERRARVDAAAAELAALAAAADDQQERRDRLDAARQAAAVAPLHRLAEQAAGSRRSAARRADVAVAEVAPVLGLLLVGGASDVTRADLVDAERVAVAEEARARAAVPEEARLGELETRLATLDRRRGELQERLAGLAARVAELPELLTATRAELETARAAATELPALATQVETLTARLAAHEETTALAGQLVEARSALSEAQQVVSQVRERWLDAREARLEGMAAEIAGGLAVGACCPVCGSADHPQKAVPAPGAPDAAAEKDALRALDDAKAVELVHDEQVRDLTTRLAAARERAGDDERSTVAGRLSEATAALTRARSLAAGVDPAQARAAAVEAEQAAVADRSAGLAAELSGLDAEHAGCAAEAERVRAVVQQLLAGSGHSRLDHLAAALAQRLEEVRAALRAVDELAAAASAEREAAAALAETAADAGFDDVDAALAAVLDRDACAELQRRCEAHEHRLAAVREVLAEPGASEVAAATLPDLAALEAGHAEALAALGDARSEVARWTSRADRLDRLVAELAEALARWAPVREELDLTDRLCSFVEGKSADNRLQMRLSAYVLAYRLSQVVSAANERLARMSDGRYALEHTGRRGAGETRGGLSLLIRDAWSGEARDPATLSGGETFVVSLALALGLADVITQEAGGADLDTLFVDEGFGSLDADTLDDVLDVLDSLRDGGRIVGVVSHVAEMRDRIPTQLVVAKGRQGSTLRIVG